MKILNHGDVDAGSKNSFHWLHFTEGSVFSRTREQFPSKSNFLSFQHTLNLRSEGEKNTKYSTLVIEYDKSQLSGSKRLTVDSNLPMRCIPTGLFFPSSASFPCKCSSRYKDSLSNELAGLWVHYWIFSVTTFTIEILARHLLLLLNSSLHRLCKDLFVKDNRQSTL